MIRSKIGVCLLLGMSLLTTSVRAQGNEEIADAGALIEWNLDRFDFLRDEYDIMVACSEIGPITEISLQISAIEALRAQYIAALTTNNAVLLLATAIALDDAVMEMEELVTHYSLICEFGPWEDPDDLVPLPADPGEAGGADEEPDPEIPDPAEEEVGGADEEEPA